MPATALPCNFPRPKLRLQLQDAQVVRPIGAALTAASPRVRHAAALCILGLSRSVKACMHAQLYSSFDLSVRAVHFVKSCILLSEQAQAIKAGLTLC